MPPQRPAAKWPSRRLVWLLALWWAAPAAALDDAEAAALARLADTLQRLQQQVDAAAQQADSSAAVRFRYDWLRRDLQLMQQGIEAHLAAPREPRPVPPLQLDYRR